MSSESSSNPEGPNGLEQAEARPEGIPRLTLLLLGRDDVGEGKVVMGIQLFAVVEE